jgi:hypothetical protein
MIMESKILFWLREIEFHFRIWRRAVSVRAIMAKRAVGMSIRVSLAIRDL